MRLYAAAERWPCKEPLWIAGYTMEVRARLLERLLPVLIDTRVAPIEQPFCRGEEAALVGPRSPIPIAVDESIQGLADLPELVAR